MLLADTDAAQGDLPAAMRAAQQAIRMDPKRSASYLNLGEFQERNKDLPSAERNYQTAISVDPKSTSAVLAYGGFCERQKRFADAERQYQTAIALAPRDLIPRATLAKLYLEEGHEDVAEQSLRDAKAALKDSPAGYRILGDFYLTRGESD